MIQKRYYQIEAEDAIFRKWYEQGVSSLMLQQSTGAGKTVIFGAVVDRLLKMGKRVIVFAHREELIVQAAKRLMLDYSIKSGIIKAGFPYRPHERVQVASIDTFRKFVRKKELPEADAIIIDEAHHSVSNTYASMIKLYKEQNPEVKVLGVTATPWRLSGQGFTELFSELIIGPSTLQLEQEDFLCVGKVYVAEIDHEELSKVKVEKGDYNEAEIAKMMGDEAKILSIVNNYIKFGEGGQAIVYAVNRDISRRIAKAFNDVGIPAVHVEAGTDDRQGIFSRFANRDIRVITNVDIAGEGNDIPSIEIVILAAPSKSLSKYLQRCGRGSRLAPGKTHYKIFDHAGQYEEHGPPNLVHDWQYYFKGVPKKKKGEEKKQPRVVIVKGENGQQFMTELSKLPKNFMGEILREVNPNERSTELLLKQQFDNFLTVASLFGHKTAKSIYDLKDFAQKKGINLQEHRSVITVYIAKKVGWTPEFVSKFLFT